MLIGLGVAAVGIWIFAPQYIAGALPLLVVLVCPLSMVAMALMMRGSMSSGPKATPEQRLADLELQRAALAKQIAATRAELEPTGAPTARRAS